MPPDLEDAEINQTTTDEKSGAITESLMDEAETQGNVFVTESTSGELAEGPEILEVVKPRGEVEEELSNFNSADPGLFSSCEHQTEHSTALIEDIIMKKPDSKHGRQPEKPLIEVLSSSETTLPDDPEPDMKATVKATGGVENLADLEKKTEGERWAFSADKNKQLEPSIVAGSDNGGGLLIEEIDSDEEIHSSKPESQQTVEDRVWQLATKAGSTLDSDRVELDHQTKEKLHKRLNNAGLLDKVSLAF